MRIPDQNDDQRRSMFRKQVLAEQLAGTSRHPPPAMFL
jgi:hypothetical protein